MDDISEENKQEEIWLTDTDIFTQIWLSPRRVFKFINDHRYDSLTTLLVIFGGITSALNRASDKHMGDSMSLFAVLIISVIVGAVFGWLSYYIYAALMSWTGKWMKGKGNTDALFRMISYSLIPSLIILPLILTRILLIGNKEFQNNVDLYSEGTLVAVLCFITYFLEFMFGLWTLFIIVVGISEIQQFSIGKAIVNLILPGAMILAIIAPIAAIMYLVTHFLS